jgi:DNA (cytosine-5)-methyltransferase 1
LTVIDVSYKTIIMRTDLPTIASLFSGCGGLDLGFKWAGFPIVWANEIEKDASSTYNRFIGEHINTCDINSIIENVPKTDIVIGGPPCQAFSMVGKRLIDQDLRGKLVYSFHEVIKRNQPNIFLMENVPGLLSSKVNGENLHIYLARHFTSYGYNVSIHKLNAVDFFVPQKRKRVFMLGIKKTHKHVPLEKGSELIKACLNLTSNSLPVNVSQALEDLPELSKNSTNIFYKMPPHSLYSNFMRIDSEKNITLHEMPTMSEKDKLFVKFIPPGGNYWNIPDEHCTQRILNFKKTGGRTTTYGRLHPEYPSYTINTYFNRPNVGTNYHYKEDRLITVREALRLQSFPDWFEPVYKSKRSLHMQIGNAVPPLLAFGIAEVIKEIYGLKNGSKPFHNN